MKNIRIFYLKIFNFWVVKFSVYLNRHVFEMLSDFLCALLHAKSLHERGLLLKETKLLPLGANSFFLKYLSLWYLLLHVLKCLTYKRVLLLLFFCLFFGVFFVFCCCCFLLFFLFFCFFVCLFLFFGVFFFLVFCLFVCLFFMFVCLFFLIM